jgi:hypothetical protein
MGWLILWPWRIPPTPAWTLPVRRAFRVPGEVSMSDADPLPFSLDWLAGAAERPKTVLSACPDGHLLVNERSCWAPLRFSPDLRALYCEPAEHLDDGSRPEPGLDEAFARFLHGWLDSRPRHYTALREAVERWLVTRRL